MDNKTVNSLKSLYGLPMEVEYCKSCLMSNQRPNMCSEHNNKEKQNKSGIGFTDGICDACRFKDNKDNKHNEHDKHILTHNEN